jgi:outer membrane protein assembly factor BamB
MRIKIKYIILCVLLFFGGIFFIYFNNIFNLRYFPNNNALIIYPNHVIQQGMNSGKNNVFGNGYINKSFKFNSKSSIVSTPTIMNGVAYFGANNDYVYAISDLTGKLIWKYKTDNQVMTQPIIANGMLYVGSGDNFFQKGNVVRGTGQNAIYALSLSTGKFIWKYNTSGENMSSFVYKKNTIYEANGNSKFYAINAKNGHMNWKTSFKGIDSMSSLNLSGNFVYFGSGNIDTTQYINSINIKTHKLQWSKPLPMSFGGVTDNSPSSNSKYVVIEGLALTSTVNKFNQVVYVLNKRTGQIQWTYKLGVGIRPRNMETANSIIVGNNLYTGNTVGNGRFYSFNINTGKMNWYVKLYGDQKSAAVLQNGILYLADSYSNFYSIKASNGIVLGIHKFISTEKMNAFTASNPTLVDNEIYIGNLNGYLYAFPINYLYQYNFQLYKYYTWYVIGNIFGGRIDFQSFIKNII